jgi:hypothetical protein
LRLRQLATLVHEVAHHDDSMLRTGRASDVITKSRYELRADGFPEWAGELARLGRGRRLST